MQIFLLVLGVVGFLWGFNAGKVSGTMSNGPRQGTRFGAVVFAALFGLVVGAIGAFSGLAALAIPGAVGFLATVLMSAFTTGAATLVGIFAGNALTR